MIPISISQEQFESYIHAAAMCDDTIFNAVMPYMERAYTDVANIMGRTGVEAMYGDANLQSAVRELVCERGFILALRHLDLVLTDSGFGVVHNDHVAPASAERVNSLEAALWKAADRSLNNLLHLLIETTQWGSQENCAAYLVNTILWDIDEAQSLCGKSDITHKEWVDLQTRIFDVEFKMAFAISDSMMRELRQHMLSNSLSDLEKLAVQIIRTAVGNMVVNKDDKEVMKATKLRLINWFDSHKDEFPTYTSSPEYTARHIERYENTKDSPAYFFC